MRVCSTALTNDAICIFGFDFGRGANGRGISAKAHDATGGYVENHDPFFLPTEGTKK